MFTKEQIKHSGATFTPRDLATYLAAKLLSYAPGKKISVLDPASGEGELLVAIGEHLTQSGINFTLTGYEANPHYLNSANERMLKFGKDNYQLITADFLKADISLPQGAELVAKERSGINNTFDVIIANPPYVRTQILGSGKAQELAKKFNLKGRVDLYYPFLMAMTESLKEGGLLGVITSNRYLFTKSGDSIRKYLSETFDILDLVDLGDTKLFEAAVLPAIFIGRKGKAQKPFTSRFSKIYEELNGDKSEAMEMASIYDILQSDKTGYFITGSKKYKKTEGILKYSASSGEAWEMLSGEESSWVSGIEKNARHRIGDFFKVRVGIKTTADKVFIGEAWDKLGDEKPETEILKDLISQENIEAWGATENLKLKVLYPHFSEEGSKKTIDLEKYPHTKKYLHTHERQLRSRKYLIDAGRQWFEIWVPHRPGLWALPKLVFPDISLTPRFCFDTGGKIVNGNCYWIVAQTEDEVEKLLFIQGIANSKLMTKYHDLVFNNKLYSGRRRYFTQYVEKYPLPDINSAIAMEIVALVKNLNESNDKEAIKQLEVVLELKVAEAFGVDGSRS